MDSSTLIKALIAIVFTLLVGGVAVVIARRSGKNMPSALLVGLTVGTAALGGVTPILFG
ncbi:hypothetical protein AB0L05_28925 [Nonomuraea pusilla]|uniref:hypothetical protein n=1 Tax=Nonomuraea pusilla TaxID=46177 RepID=UPI003328A2ED